MMSFRSDASSANGGGRQALGTASVDLSLNAFSSSHTPLGMSIFIYLIDRLASVGYTRNRKRTGSW